MKKVVFWNVTPCGSCKNLHFGGTYHLHHRGEKNERVTVDVHVNSVIVDDGGDKILRNVGSYKSHTVSHTRRLHSPKSPPCQPQILHIINWLGFVAGK
jgi:hypothetical protein